MPKRSRSWSRRLLPLVLALIPLAVDWLLVAASAAVEAMLVEDCGPPIRLDTPETLRGAVKTLEQSIADYSDGRLIQRSVVFRARYTEAGAMAEEQLIRDGVTSRWAIYHYSSATQALARIDEYGPDQRLQSIDLFDYDPAGQRVVRSHQWPPGTLRSRHIFTVGPVGPAGKGAVVNGAGVNRRILARAILTAEGKAIEASRFLFTPFGRLASVETIRGPIKEVKTCSYDSAGRLIRISSRQDGPGQEVDPREERYSYRPGQVEGQLCHGGPSRCARLVLSGGPGEQQRLTAWTPDGVLQQQRTYDSEGVLIGIDSNDMPLLGSQRVRIRRSYDPQGNWIEKVTFCGPAGAEDRDLRPCEAEERRITYYQNAPLSGAPRWVDGIQLLGRPLLLPLAPTP